MTGHRDVLSGDVAPGALELAARFGCAGLSPSKIVGGFGFVTPSGFVTFARRRAMNVRG
jgi:hypothetical protein